MINCPICNKHMKLQISKEKFEYNGDKDIEIDYEYYSCVCGERYTTNDIDKKNIIKVKQEYYKIYLDDYVLFDKVFSNFEEEKTIHEYTYMLDHYYLYTFKELKIILSNFLKYYNFETNPELVEIYNQAFESLK